MIPTEEGFYWAKQSPPCDWEVIEVFRTSEDNPDDEKLQAMMPGTEQIFELNRFIWNKKIDPPTD